MLTHHYTVEYTVKGDPQERTTRVQIIDGYSTFADLTKIIAMVRGIDPADVIPSTVVLFSVTDRPR